LFFKGILESTLVIFNVQRYSTHDGDGIRTLVFYKGCPLRCLWCSNPESFSFDYSLMYDERLCRNFGDCLKVEGSSISMKIENLRDVCTAKAITISGQVKSAVELLHEIEKDMPFYRENGGVTLTGGEPLSRGSELILFLKLLKKKEINVNMETSLHVKWEKAARCLDLVDTFLVDLKHTRKDKFRTFTNGDAELVKSNLLKLAKSNAHIIARIPVIPGFNHTVEEMTEMINFILSLKKIKEIHLLPYHTYGREKYKMLGMEYLPGQLKPVQDGELAPYIQYAQSKGARIKIGG